MMDGRPKGRPSITHLFLNLYEVSSNLHVILRINT